MCCDPIEKSGFDRNLWIWDYPNYSKNYLICADVARGDGTDYSAAQVFDLEEMEQVAEYKGQLGTQATTTLRQYGFGARSHDEATERTPPVERRHRTRNRNN